MTFLFIRLRMEKDKVFTGMRNSSAQGFEEIVKDMGLQGRLTPQQAKKKWENLKRKFKDLCLPKTGSGTEEGEVTAASWPFFEAMHEAIGQRPSVMPVATFSSGPSAQISPAVMSGPSGAVAADDVHPACSPAETEEQDVARPGPSGVHDSVASSTAEEIPRPSNRASGGKGKSPKKRKRQSDLSSLELIKEMAEKQAQHQMEADAKEEERFQRAERQMDQMLSVLTKLVDHVTKT
ncbi:uncharacterized protein [Misgurnus anguillicaudatus]|uniref:uncharacterized protein n=1 Tax=Misgurnus anguillicaudatus TaxID=75329 RepID=UPI003CCF6FFC